MANRRTQKSGEVSSVTQSSDIFAGSTLQTADLKPFQILAPDGRPVREELIPDLEIVEELYRQMARARYLDDKFMLLYKSQPARMGSYAQFGGQEASQVASAYVLEKRDYLCPMYRNTGAMITHGWPIEKAILYWRGHPDGWRIPDDLNIMPIIISIPGQIVHAAGVALGIQAQNLGAIALSYIGEGGTSQGDFHAGVNFAAARKAPAVFIIENNGWAISVPRKVQSGVDYLMRRAEGYGIPGYLVDGNDALAVYTTAKKAVDDARAGNGPSIIEQLTYRVRPHTTGDEPKAYRTEDETNEWINNRDPIKRMKAFLELEKRWNDDREVAMQAEIETEFAVALEAADNATAPDPMALLDYAMVEPTWQLEEQRAILQARVAAEGGAA